MPLVTVIMPAYQAARTLRRAMESVRAQAFTDWRMLVVDDASTDGTGDVARALAAEDPRVEVLRNEKNLGAAASRNRAWQKADSRYIALLDADDIALQNRFAAPLAVLEHETKLGVLGGSAHFIDQNGRYLRHVLFPEANDVLVRRRWYACPFLNSAVTMRREFLEALGGYDPTIRLVEDFDLWMRGAVESRYAYGNLREPLVIYTAKPVQKWAMIAASAWVRMHAGRRENRRIRGYLSAARILAEGAVEQTGIFAWRDRVLVRREVPPEVRQMTT